MRQIDFSDKIDEYFKVVVSALAQVDRGEMSLAMNEILATYERENDIYCFGNGGSAATASHMLNDFNKGISLDLEKKFRFHCLNDNTAILMAIANDISYESVFLTQMEGKLRKGDLIIAISGSGNSPNVIRGVEYARSCGCRVVGVTGFDGGELRRLADYHMHVPIRNMQVTEDVHMIFNHMMVSLFCEELRREGMK